MTTSSDPGQHVFWLASRATGVVALILVAVSVGLGLALSGRMVRRPGGPAYLKTLHEAITLTSLAMIALHGALLLGDAYLRPGLVGVLVPFQMAHQPAWTGIGIIAGWLGAFLGLSFYVRDWIGTRTWRRLHRWTLAVYALAFAHTLGSGTDARSAWLLALTLGTALVVVLAATYRFLPAERRDRGPRPAPGTAVDAG